MNDDDSYWTALTVLRTHRYDYDSHASSSRPHDPGWNPCTCSWEGYWCDFHPHVATEMIKALKDSIPLDLKNWRERSAACHCPCIDCSNEAHWMCHTADNDHE